MATKTPKAREKEDGRDTHPRGGFAQKYSHRRIPVRDAQGASRAPSVWRYERRNRDLDPQLVWRGKDEQDWSDLVTHAPPIYIQEKVHPKVLIDDLLRRSAADQKAAEDQIDLFADFNGVPEGNAKTEFYQHDANWTNRMILGDSLQVMASLAEREGLRGQVQCIYIDPPYGIKFNSNFQWSTTSRDVKDGNTDHITREPEQVKAFRDTWRDGIHSYLTYLRDRLTVCSRPLDENLVRSLCRSATRTSTVFVALLDEVFGAAELLCPDQLFENSGSPLFGTARLATVDFMLWYAKDRERVSIGLCYLQKKVGGDGGVAYTQVQDAERLAANVDGN